MPADLDEHPQCLTCISSIVRSILARTSLKGDTADDCARGFLADVLREHGCAHGSRRQPVARCPGRPLLFGHARHYVAGVMRRLRLERRLFADWPVAGPAENPWEPADPRPGPEPRAIASERETALAAALARLDRRSREFLTRHYWHGEPWTEIAASAGMTEAAVWKAAERARKQLRHHLTRSAPEGDPPAW